jgi:hypothetical protein
VLQSFVEYEIPTFEQAELAENGLSDLGPWRIADLLLADVRAGAKAPTFGDHHRQSHEWHETDIKKLRIFVRESPESVDEGLLVVPLGTSLKLRSPSRRDPQRQAANVLTSRGHGFQTSSPSTLIALLERIRGMIGSGMGITTVLDEIKIDNYSKGILRSVLAEVTHE